jgi:hypothetical protein
MLIVEFYWAVLVHMVFIIQVNNHVTGEILLEQLAQDGLVLLVGLGLMHYNGELDNQEQQHTLI